MTVIRVAGLSQRLVPRLVSPFAFIEPFLLTRKAAKLNDPANLLVDVLTLRGTDPAVIEFIEPSNALIDCLAGRLFGKLWAKGDQVIDQAANVCLGSFNMFTDDELIPVLEEPLLAETT
jgi:hypothetical protein